MSFLNTSKLMLKSLFSKPSTAPYPAVKRQPVTGARGSIDNRIDACVFCSLCQKKCPTGAITVSRDGKSWEIDRFKCIACGACVAACPKKCLDMRGEYTPPAVKKTTERFTQTPPPASAPPPAPAPSTENKPDA